MKTTTELFLLVLILVLSLIWPTFLKVLAIICIVYLVCSIAYLLITVKQMKKLNQHRKG